MWNSPGRLTEGISWPRAGVPALTGSGEYLCPDLAAAERLAERTEFSSSASPEGQAGWFLRIPFGIRMSGVSSLLLWEHGCGSPIRLARSPSPLFRQT